MTFEVEASSGVVCANLGQCLSLGFCYLSVSQLSVPHFGASAWRLKCTKHMGCNSDVVQ